MMLIKHAAITWKLQDVSTTTGMPSPSLNPRRHPVPRDSCFNNAFSLCKQGSESSRECDSISRLQGPHKPLLLSFKILRGLNRQLNTQSGLDAKSRTRAFPQ